MTLTIEESVFLTWPHFGRGGGQIGMLLATRRAKRIEAGAGTPPRLIFGNKAVAAKSTPSGRIGALELIAPCEPPEVYSNRAGHGVC